MDSDHPHLLDLHELERSLSVLFAESRRGTSPDAPDLRPTVLALYSHPVLDPHPQTAIAAVRSPPFHTAHQQTQEITTMTPLFSKGFDGLYVLIDQRNGDRICIGDTLNGCLIRSGSAPHKPSSSGFVHTANRELYAHVVKAQWVKVFSIGDRVTMTDAACEENPHLMTDELNGTVLEITKAGKLYIQTDDCMTGIYNPEMWERA